MAKDSIGKQQVDLTENLIGCCYLNFLSKSKKKYNYRVQDLKCCNTCKFVIFDWEGELYCAPNKKLGLVAHIAICDLYKKQS